MADALSATAGTSISGPVVIRTQVSAAATPATSQSRMPGQGRPWSRPRTATACRLNGHRCQCHAAGPPRFPVDRRHVKGVATSCAASPRGSSDAWPVAGLRLGFAVAGARRYVDDQVLAGLGAILAHRTLRPPP